jgi:hypothetical protein
MLNLDKYELEVVDCDQGSDTWHACRAGLPTASEFATILAKGRGGGVSLTRAKYLRKLCAERVTGRVIQTWNGNADTERGHEQEPEARKLYAFMRDVDPQLVGFMRRGPVGASPDSLIGSDGLLEIKSKRGDIHIELLETGEMPPEHKAQVQGQLWVSGRKWVDFMSYSPGLPPFIQRIERDPIYIAELAKAVKVFLDELDVLTARISKMQEAA